MSSGRYELVYSGDVAAHGAASGLGIRVFDSHTSGTRSTGTFSGGESFYASLSLALGLAEVVQQESGGKPLETLFIDEGFGTLDARTLDQVMDVIDDLREGGRTVGLVSHVDELRNRVTARIEVHPTKSGSTIEVVGV
jgi:exonuclease SbcC